MSRRNTFFVHFGLSLSLYLPLSLFVFFLSIPFFLPFSLTPSQSKVHTALFTSATSDLYTPPLTTAPSSSSSSRSSTTHLSAEFLQEQAKKRHDLIQNIGIPWDDAPVILVCCLLFLLPLSYPPLFSSCFSSLSTLPMLCVNRFYIQIPPHPPFVYSHSVSCNGIV